MTEMLKGTLEGIVLAVLASRSAYGYSVNVRGREYLDEFWSTWSFLSERIEQLHEGGK